MTRPAVRARTRPRAVGRTAGLAPALVLLGALAALGCDEPAADPAPPRGAAGAEAGLGADGDGGAAADGPGWPAYGGDRGGRRYAPHARITPANVQRLEVAWTHRTGDVADGTGRFATTSAFEATPILVDPAGPAPRSLVLCTPFNRVVALDPATGAERWRFDPEIDATLRYANQLVCRGVAQWRDAEAEPGAPCAHRILTATNDARLLAIDAATGERCRAFGERGEVALSPGVGGTRWPGEYQVTSPPAVAGDVVVVGSAVADNQRVDAPSGVVRGFDARTGALRWAWDVAPEGHEAIERAEGTGWALGSPNVWAPMSVDAERGLVFVPTGNPAPDYYGATRRALETYGSSVVALRAETGEVAWHFQTVHHDLWDYDVPAQPTLFELEREGRRVPAVVQATKMGLLFVLRRETGAPLFPVEERPVPQSDVPGERTAPTQPFPLAPPPLARHALEPEDAWGLTFWDRGRCRERIERLRGEGIYTPPSLGAGSLVVPGNAGGTNWGGVAIDPERGLLLARTTNLPFEVALVPREDYPEERADGGESAEYAPQEGTPYGMRRAPLLSPLGIPCNPPPWGTLAAVELGTGELRWQVPLGTVRDIAPLPLPIGWGTPGVGGPHVTAGGLAFVGAALDDFLRAFDVETGEELWKGRLPAGGQATPMSYSANGRQYVVIAAGGHGRAGSTLGDHVVAFALPAGEGVPVEGAGRER